MRCFLGLFPPAEVQASIREALLALGEHRLRWTAAENLHLTLLFLGERSEAEVERVRQAMDRALRATATFEIRLGELGSFPPRGRPRVLFLGLIEGAAEVRALHDALRSELPRELRPREQRFHPHLTVTRAKGRLSASERERLSEAMAGRRWDFRCEGVDLMRSELSCSGATYHRVHGVRLRGA